MSNWGSEQLHPLFVCSSILLQFSICIPYFISYYISINIKKQTWSWNWNSLCGPFCNKIFCAPPLLCIIYICLLILILFYFLQKFWFCFVLTSNISWYSWHFKSFGVVWTLKYILPLSQNKWHVWPLTRLPMHNFNR
jgi:hypothetical protein